MRIAVFSDTHGRCGGMLSGARRVRPDVLVHLGDCVRDAEELRRAFPEIPLYSVSGNCDYCCDIPDKLLFMAGPVSVFASHGHRYGVKYGLDRLLLQARLRGTGLVLFGHTHIPLLLEDGGMQIMNPGTAGGIGAEPSFGVADISDSGGLVCRIEKIIP